MGNLFGRHPFIHQCPVPWRVICLSVCLSLIPAYSPPPFPVKCNLSVRSNPYAEWSEVKRYRVPHLHTTTTTTYLGAPQRIQLPTSGGRFQICRVYSVVYSILQYNRKYWNRKASILSFHLSGHMYIHRPPQYFKGRATDTMVDCPVRVF